MIFVTYTNSEKHTCNKTPSHGGPQVYMRLLAKLITLWLKFDWQERIRPLWVLCGQIRNKYSQPSVTCGDKGKDNVDFVDYPKLQLSPWKTSKLCRNSLKGTLTSTRTNNLCNLHHQLPPIPMSRIMGRNASAVVVPHSDLWLRTQDTLLPETREVLAISTFPRAIQGLPTKRILLVTSHHV